MSLDLGGLAQAISNAIISSMQGLLSPLPKQFLLWLSEQLTTLWNGIWHSGANLLGTPADLTINYPAAVVMGVGIQTLVPSITLLAVAMLGVRQLWHSVADQPDSLRTDLVHNILLAVFMAGMSMLILRQAVALAGMAGDELGRFDYTPDFSPSDISNLGNDFLVTVVSLILMLIFGFRLMLRAAYRIVLLLVTLPFAPVATIMWAFPSTRWIASAYWITVGGWLVGGVLAIAVVSLGVQIAVHETGGGGLLKLLLPAAMLQLAYDMMTWIPEWGSGRLGGPKPPGFGGFGTAAATVAGAAAVGGVVGAAASSSGAAGGLGLAGGNGVAGALMPASIGAGYD